MADQDIEGRPSSDGAETAPEGSVANDASTAGEREIAMTDGAASPAPFTQTQTGAGRTGTPVRHTANGGERLETSSRAASAHPEASFTIPSEAPFNGAPVRQYINSKLTGPLLEGMKMIAKEQPRDPLRVLGEYLLQRSRELEGTK